jgi:Integrase core domain.
MSIDSEIGGPGAEDRQLVYARMGMSSHAIRHVENMVYGSPSRKVGKAALTNVVTRFDSLKNGKPRVLESHTCELVCAYELELDQDVIGYYAQVPCRRIERRRSDGRRHITSANLDFLVFRQSKVELIECKPEAWLLKESAKELSDWDPCEGEWKHRAYENFATEHEIGFSVWSPPHNPGIYLQNLEACYAITRYGADPTLEKVVRRVVARIATRPTSVAELCEEVDGFSARSALWMLSKSLAFGPWKSTPVLMTDRFLLYGDRRQAMDADELTAAMLRETLSQPEIADTLLRARATDVAKGRERLAKLDAIERGQEPTTRRMAQLKKRVDEAVAKGRPALSACITQYENSGNHVSRLLPEQEHAMETVIARLWNTGHVKEPKNLFHFFEDECARLGTRPSGKTAFYARLRQENPMRHALATGGLRAFQAIRPATDTRMRSLPPIGYGHTLHIDSSDLDNRIAENILKGMPSSKAKFYIGIDGATNHTMAHALIFGSARTDGLAILMREYVRRHGFLPHVIHVDRGPENTSFWMEEFAEGYASLRFSPTAGSAWNGIAENAIRQVNHQVAHQLIGSTEPDQKGRSVDGRFKSYRNAKTSFATILEQFLAFAYDDLPNTPGADGRTPHERKVEAIAILGELGIPCELNEAFLLRTSIRVEVKKHVNARKGIRTEEGYFNSDELIRALRFDDVEELRSDCEDPTLMRVRIGNGWVKAFHRTAISEALLPIQEKLFDLLYAPTHRSQSRAKRDSISHTRHGRIRNANFATLTVDQVSRTPLAEATADPQEVQGRELCAEESMGSRKALWDSLALCEVQGASK